MSILTISHDDVTPQGRPLPNGEYRATVLDAQVVTKERGTSFVRQYGNLRTRDGATEVPGTNGDAPFRIGARRLFDRQWIDHQTEKAQEIGLRMLKLEAVSAGFVPKPAKGEHVELPFNDWQEYAAALVGKDVLVRTRLKTRYIGADGKTVSAPTPEQIASGELTERTEPEIAAWLSE